MLTPGIAQPVEQQRTRVEALCGQARAQCQVVEQICHATTCGAAHDPVNGIASRCAMEGPQGAPAQESTCEIVEVYARSQPQRVLRTVWF